MSTTCILCPECHLESEPSMLGSLLGAATPATGKKHKITTGIRDRDRLRMVSSMLRFRALVRGNEWGGASPHLFNNVFGLVISKMVFGQSRGVSPDDIAQPAYRRPACSSVYHTLRRFAPLGSRMKPPLTGKTAQEPYSAQAGF